MIEMMLYRRLTYSNHGVSLITDRKIVVRDELCKLKCRIDKMTQELLALRNDFNELKKEYETIDKRRAFLDGRLRVIESAKEGGKRKPRSTVEKLSTDEVLRLIAELEKMQKKSKEDEE